MTEASNHSELFSRNKKMIGDGGIIALTAMKNKKKVSIPVMYKWDLKLIFFLMRVYMNTIV